MSHQTVLTTVLIVTRAIAKWGTCVMGATAIALGLVLFKYPPDESKVYGVASLCLFGGALLIILASLKFRRPQDPLFMRMDE